MQVVTDNIQRHQSGDWNILNEDLDEVLEQPRNPEEWAAGMQ